MTLRSLDDVVIVDEAGRGEGERRSKTSSSAIGDEDEDKKVGVDA